MLAIVRDNSADKQATLKSYEKLVRFRRLVAERSGFNESKLNAVLELEGDINYQMPDSGDAALHFADDERTIAEALINRGADPTIANRKGQTVVHYSLNYRRKYFRYESTRRSYCDYLLETIHTRGKNTTNFADAFGFSHFHVACMNDNAELVDFFLNNGVSVDEAVSLDSLYYSGNTPLHFAVEYGRVDLVDKLLSHGADARLRNASGMTPLHVLVGGNMEIIQHMSMYRIQVYDYPEFGLRMNEEIAMAEVKTNEKIIRNILSRVDKTTLDRVGLYPFYVMRSSEDASLNFTENDINERVRMDSAFWPGYTALHFAAHFSIDTVKLLLEKGADIEAKDAHGVTPFDLCVGRYSVDDIHSIISSHSTWRNILLTDGKTKLLELVFAMRNPEDLPGFLAERDINEIFVPRDSPLWPGFTVLHLAVTLSKKRMHPGACDHGALLDDKRNERHANESIEACLRLGANVAAPDRDGSTPIHLAFRRMDLHGMYYLLERCEGESNPTDKDNLSLLHIACAVENERLVKELLASGADPNAAVSSSFQWDPEVKYFHELSSDEQLHVWPGSTALHTALTTSSKVIVKLLLEAGADLDAKDAKGLAPLHRLVVAPGPMPRDSDEDKAEYDDLLSRFVSRDCVVDGLSYLHVAAYRGYPKFLGKLLNLGADVNSAVVARDRATPTLSHGFARCTRKTNFSYYFHYFAGDTPLHMALDRVYSKGDISETLVSRDADVLAKNSKGYSPICEILEDHRYEYECLLRLYVTLMSEDDEKRIFVEMGLTRLHVACRLRDEKMIRKCLEKGANVNARVRDHSKIWPGFTPLHIVVADHRRYRVGVTKRQHEKWMCRMVQLLLNGGADVMIADAKGETPLMINICDNHIDRRSRPAHMDILWRKLKNSRVNPVSNQGISHFHLACVRKDVALVEKFLKLGVDPNQTVDYHSKDCRGYTPLHFALCRVVRGFAGNDFPPLRTVNLLLRYGANVNAMDMHNITPLRLAASYPSWGALPYKRMFWAGADPEAKNLYDLAPSSNRLFNVKNGEVRRFFCVYCRVGGRYLLNKLVSPFGGCIRCCYRMCGSKVRR